MGKSNFNIENLEALIKPVIEIMGYEFWGLEITAQNKDSILRVYVDADQGIKLDDLTRISNQLSGILDVEYGDQDRMRRFHLEVSSPGLNRPIFKIEQYKKFIGEMVKIKTLGEEAYVRHNYLGRLESVTEDGVTIICDGEKVIIPFSKIWKAHKVYQYE